MCFEEKYKTFKKKMSLLENMRVQIATPLTEVPRKCLKDFWLKIFALTIYIIIFSNILVSRIRGIN
jgi:hypothetical protein